MWGSGTPMREFLHVDDMAAASIHVMELAHEVWLENTQPMLSHINVGTGVDCTIRELAQTIAKVVGYQRSVVFDASKPDGTPRKLLDVTPPCISLAGITKSHWKRGLPALTSGSLRIKTAFGG
ncbi:GDP-L-fucose synthetase [Escherichia coli]|uniref:GDP-L-fucose synthetase n=1 Tax=Escherichia coli TaxID=562 RepID=A0A377B9R0_ECOLX|nr:GDP-L-fucose synthetase [Escherichia coli]